jgi:hypothetical protein
LIYLNWISFYLPTDLDSAGQKQFFYVKNLSKILMHFSEKSKFRFRVKILKNGKSEKVEFQNNQIGPLLKVASKLAEKSGVRR